MKIDIEKELGSPDMVNHPPHYTQHPSGIECIQITEYMTFCLGNAVKYCFRGGSKVQSSELEDLQKAHWYAKRELERLPTRRPLPSIHPWAGAEQGEGEYTSSCCDKEWVFDVALFFAPKTQVHPCDGVGDVCVPPTVPGNGCVSQGWRSHKQQAEQSYVGIQNHEYPQEGEAWKGTTGGAQVVGKNYGGTSAFCEIRHASRSGIGGRNWGIHIAGQSYPCRAELAAYIAVEPEEWRKRAVFYLVAGHPEKAIWYIDREIARRKKK
jgi:hypothetical protein